MKILPAIKTINSDILSMKSCIKQATKDGYILANKTANIYHHNFATRYFNITRNISSRLIKSITVKNLPYFLASIGLLIPIPLTSVVMLGIGYIIRYFSQRNIYTNSDMHVREDVFEKQS